MAVPSVMNDLSTTPGSNSPAGSESPISTDDFHRAIQAILRTTNAKGSDIASATTTNIGAATGEFVDVTGTTTITGLGTIGAGIVRTVRFTGALTLTHNATSLILPTGRNILTAAGDFAMFRSLGSGNWVCVDYIRANGYPLNQRKGADVASATTLPLINDGNYFDVTGSVDIETMASLGVGTWIGLHFDGILDLIHSADLVLPSGANIETAAGDEAIFVEYATGDWRCVSYTKASGEALVQPAVGYTLNDLLHVQDQKTSGTDGGTFSNGAWRTRTLNTVVTNNIPSASLGSNQITLPAGTYYIFATAPAYQTGSHKTKLRDITNTADILIGSSERNGTGAGTGTLSITSGIFTLSGTTVLEFQHQCVANSSTNGLGVASGFSVVEVYADVAIWRVA
jgi:hypothetical protein